ncbi:MAG: RdgB/HAM1 family non-canonical purine NTP pyrophosphatase [Proteobacteria bacterium]|nr:RdgB/HAM1 family non-canonical purine NTP pyrophosphatase [Pseudomonadota bacterium]
MGDGRTLVVASNNAHKIAELSAILGPKWNVLSAQQVAPGVTWDETGNTFVENARIKLRALRPYTSHCILADDSGLCVDALDGRPGVFSSSFGGIEGDHARNNARLLKELWGVETARRTASFICVLVFQNEKGRELVCEGRCEGAIASVPDGQGGFGYDPIFVVRELNCTMASLSETVKNSISHRGNAMTALLPKLETEF